MRRAWADLGAVLPAASFWRRGEDGRGVLNATLLGQAGRALHGAAWLNAPPEPAGGGLFDRLRAPGTIRRVQAQVAGILPEVTALQARLTDWLAWVQRLRWSQADLLQVMEELEPQAQTALRAYFSARAGLSAAHAEVGRLVMGWWPACPPDLLLGLYAGMADLPSAAAAYALTALGHAPDPAARAAFLARYGHRGPGEAEPEAQRWADHPDRLLACAALPAARDAAHGQAVRTAAEQAFQARLGGRWRQLAPALAQARELCRAADLAWDCFVRVMSAAQAWLRAVAVEARAAGLIAEVTEVSYLELEELKQVATGEWHGGRSAAVRGEVARRRAERANARAEPPQPPQPAGPGQAAGPLFRSVVHAERGATTGENVIARSDLCDEAISSTARDCFGPNDGPRNDAAQGIFRADGAQDAILRYAQAIVLVDVADPGQAPCWLAAAGLLDAAGDPWSPGMVAARALAVPAISGLPPDLWQAASGQMVVMDAGAGRAALAS
jgi:hypothetical protein